MSFSFNSFAQAAPSNTNSYLKPYTINKNVTIKNVEFKEGSTDNGPWKSMVITFGNDEGIHNDSTFFLDINDPKVVERNTIDTSNGGKRQLPSRWEQTYYKLAAIGYAFAPDLIEKFNKVVGKCKTFEDFIKTYKSMIDKVVNKTTTNMKLVGRNSNGTTYASLPSCVGIAQAKDENRAQANNVNVGDWYTWMVSPFGNNLMFSAYEESQKNNISSAKPTNMDTVDTTNKTDSSTDIEEIDFDSLL